LTASAVVASWRSGAVAPQRGPQFVGTFVTDGVCPIEDHLHLIGGQLAGVPD
jgi:hypothetical protein